MYLQNNVYKWENGKEEKKRQKRGIKEKKRD